MPFIISILFVTLVDGDRAKSKCRFDTISETNCGCSQFDSLPHGLDILILKVGALQVWSFVENKVKGDMLWTAMKESWRIVWPTTC
jgi:hypothetical protein